MSSLTKIGSHKTSIFTDSEGFTNIIYHSTAVVRFSEVKDKIILNSGGYLSNTTKARMNQTANQFRLGYSVFQKNFDWFVKNAIGEVLPFTDNMVLTFPN